MHSVSSGLFADGESANERAVLLKTNAQFETNFFTRAVSIFQAIEGFIALLLLACVVAVLAFSMQPYYVTSASMAPAMPVGALALIYTHAEPGNILVGDVVAYRADTGNVVIHRVMNNDTQLMEITTKGDANSTPDTKPVAYADVVGKCALTVPVAGFVLEWILANKLFVLLAVIGGNVFLAFFSWLADRMWRERKKLIK